MKEAYRQRVLAQRTRIRSLREALGVDLEGLARRMGRTTTDRLLCYEQGETHDCIKLEHRMADALGVPWNSWVDYKHQVSEPIGVADVVARIRRPRPGVVPPSSLSGKRPQIELSMCQETPAPPMQPIPTGPVEEVVDALIDRAFDPAVHRASAAAILRQMLLEHATIVLALDQPDRLVPAIRCLMSQVRSMSARSTSLLQIALASTIELANHGDVR